LAPGPLRLRRVEFAVVEDEVNDVLFGRDWLKKLGVNLDAHLRSVKEVFSSRFSEGFDMTDGISPFADTTSKLADQAGNNSTNKFNFSYLGVSYHQSEEDPVEWLGLLQASHPSESGSSRFIRREQRGR
jgi:hypothetical protein